MYEEIGKKIKKLAKIIFYLETVAAIISGLAMMCMDDEYLLFTGLLTMVLGPLAAWLSALLLYGFGELIDKACDIERNTRGSGVKSDVLAKEDAERIRKLESLRAQNLISEEEYQQAINKKD